MHNFHEKINNSTNIIKEPNMLQIFCTKGDRHILIYQDELIFIVSRTLLQILGAICNTVLVPYVTALGFLE